MRPRSVLSSVLAAAALSAVGSRPAAVSPTSPAAMPHPTTTLKMATMEGRGAPYADSVEEFARQVEQLSDGSLRLQIIWERRRGILWRVWPQSGAGGRRVGAERQAGGRADPRACLGRTGRDEPAGAAGALPRLDRGARRTDRAGRTGGGDAGRSRQAQESSAWRCYPKGCATRSGSRDRSSRCRTTPERRSARLCPMPRTGSWRRWRRNRSNSTAWISFRQSPAGRSTEQTRNSRWGLDLPGGHVHRQCHLLPEGERHRRERRYVRATSATSTARFCERLPPRR